MDSIVLHPSCAVIPAVWLIQQRGSELQAWAFPERYNQGISAPNDVGARIMPAHGTISGSKVVLDDGTYRWELDYDAASRHLRGTRNGTPVWALRQLVVRTETCLPPP